MADRHDRVQPDPTVYPVLYPCPACTCLDLREGQRTKRTTRAMEPRLTLESCICGQCYDCPDGYHYHRRDLPCSCTADCAHTGDADCPCGACPGGEFGPVPATRVRRVWEVSARKRARR